MVILVDKNDTIRGKASKIEAHRKGLLHRAFSVFLFNSKGEVLLQQRAWDKYHSGGLWTNSCCSHPQTENIMKEAEARLNQEMGITASLTFLFKFHYRTGFENGLTEHEIDHVFIGYTDAIPRVNPEEVAAYRYVDPDLLGIELKKSPDHYTYWFRAIAKKVLEEVKKDPQTKSV